MSEKRSLSNATPIYTEDDTFRILARPNIDKMVDLHFAWRKKIISEGNLFNSSWNIPFMKYHGWTWTEFLIAKRNAGYTI
jgi:hypothetical protein